MKKELRFTSLLRIFWILLSVNESNGNESAYNTVAGHPGCFVPKFLCVKLNFSQRTEAGNICQEREIWMMLQTAWNLRNWKSFPNLGKILRIVSTGNTLHSKIQKKKKKIHQCWFLFLGHTARTRSKTLNSKDFCYCHQRAVLIVNKNSLPTGSVSLGTGWHSPLFLLISWVMIPQAGPFRLSCSVA